MTDIKAILKAQQSSIELMPLDAIIKYAKKYNIHKQSNNEFHLANIQKIKARLTELGVDPETVRSE